MGELFFGELQIHFMWAEFWSEGTSRNNWQRWREEENQEAENGDAAAVEWKLWWRERVCVRCTPGNSVIEIGNPLYASFLYSVCSATYGGVCISFLFSIGFIPLFLSIFLSPRETKVCVFAKKCSYYSLVCVCYPLTVPCQSAPTKWWHQ